MKDQKKPEKTVTKPFVQGTPFDARTWTTALKLFLVTVVSVVLFLICSSILSVGILWIRIALGGGLLLAYWAILFGMGVNDGTDHVDYGEKLWKRRERGEEIDEKLRRQAWHPLKGGVSAFLGALPFLFCGILLAFVAKRQIIGYGALPSWISSFGENTEAGAALSYYHAGSPTTLEDILRIIVRLVLMPFVSIVGGDNADGMLTLERISALLMLIAPLSYAIGYLQGPRVRSRVHTDIAANNRKRARKEKKRRQARARSTNQLN